MAPSPGSDNYHKHFFNDPTLSDLTIRLRDRTLHVHRIVLCRRSAYFEKLLLGGFKENGLKEIELHEDDPDAMIALFRCIYDLPCDDPDACSTTLQSLAEVCVVAEKYQVRGVEVKIAEKMEDTLWAITEKHIDEDTYGGRKPDDFLAATKIVFDGTSKQDNVCRIALVKFCVLCIRDLKKISGFSKLLKNVANWALQLSRMIALVSRSRDPGAVRATGADKQYHAAPNARRNSRCRTFAITATRANGRAMIMSVKRLPHQYA